MKKLLIAGNWKMNTNVFESKILVETILAALWKTELTVELLVCPPFTSLCSLAKLVKDTPIRLGAQNCHYAERGAYTGEVSPQMLQYIGCEYIILGHSERRTHFKEDDELIAKKLKAVIDINLIPILCIGETYYERMSNRTYEVLDIQLTRVLESLSLGEIHNVVIAYEPVWAIGTGISASPEQADEAHRWIKDFLVEKFSANRNELTVLYGGSMNASNSKELLLLPDVDGGLVGASSIDAESFTKIIRIAEEISKS